MKNKILRFRVSALEHKIIQKKNKQYRSYNVRISTETFIGFEPKKQIDK